MELDEIDDMNTIWSVTVNSETGSCCRLQTRGGEGNVITDNMVLHGKN